MAIRPKIPAHLQFPLGLFLFSRLAAGLWLVAFGIIVLKPGFSLGAGYAAPMAGIPTGGILNETLLLPWYRWDTLHYLEVALQGYTTSLNNTAWPPLYSLLIYLFSLVLPNPLLAALLVSNLATLAALWILYRLVSAEFDVQTARWTLVWLVAFPTAFFLTAAYSESLFLALAAGALFAARRRRFWLAAGLAALTSLTRVLGVLLILPLAWEVWESKPEVTAAALRRALPLAIIPLPYLLFAIWVRFGLGAAWPWQTVSTGWEMAYALPWTGIVGNLRALVQAGQGYPLPLGTTLLDLAGVGFGCGLLAAGARRLPISFTIYTGVLLAASLVKVTTGDLLVSTSRYLLPLFPLFITQAILVRKRWLRTGLLALVLILQLLLAAVFWAGFWVG